VATYREFCGHAGLFDGVQVGEDVWSFELPGTGEDRTQRVFVFHETMPPDLEFLQVKSAFTLIDSVDCAQVIKDFGQLNVGAIGYNPNFDAQGNEVDGFLTITSSFPLLVLDFTEPSWFFLYLRLVARAADTLEQRLSDGANAPDMF
jgi:hypothetical protein